MGLMQELYKTYETALHCVGAEDEYGKILLPIAHSTANAQIEIEINLDGEIKNAQPVEREQTVTIIPVTEDSGSRGNGNNPHPLFDKLCYIAGDYVDYVSKDKEDYFNAYIEQLAKWREFGCHPYVDAI